ncbi:MAG: C1 family peptidase [Verrucomicrobia bacterium]|nr:C1 family peptidase [Verrucomicrobiota bacterium]
MPRPNSRKNRRYGWIPDLPDQRDHLYAAPPAVLTKLPDRVDLRPVCPPVYDQGELGSCTANAIAGAIQFDLKKERHKPLFTPSRLFIYYNERVLEGTVDSDSGAMIRDGIKSVARQGDCPEPDWPYDIARFTVKPPPRCYTEAIQHRAVQYQRLTPVLNQLKGCLVSGYPFVFGFTVYESFESPGVARTGVVPMPASDEQVIGGHAVLAVGYNENQQRFIVRNSWGTKWGLKGYFTMPYGYVTNPTLADDLWTIRVVS